VKFILAYHAQGIPVYGLSIQNEPLNEPGIKNWQGCRIPADTALKIFAEYIEPAFLKNKITTKLYCFDHNWDEGVNYISKIYNNKKAGDLISGSMWHHYAGLPKAMTTAHTLFPNKEIWFSEGCATTWHSENYVDFKNSKGSFMNFAWNVINVPRNWCQTMMMYQIALDTAHGPAVFSPATNYGMITVNQSNGHIEYRPEYYTLGHISKFVYPNAYRIKSNQYEGDIESVAFKNPDHSIVLLLSNRTTFSRNVKIKTGRKELIYLLPGESLATLKWNSEY
jgi:glucosylceramidase